MKNTPIKIEDALEYDPDTGNLYWKIDIGTRARKGRFAGSINGKGYIKIQLNGIAYLGHQIAFYLMTGRWAKEIDHKNRIRHDNRWHNLREASRSLNIRNRGPFSQKVIRNKFGHKGIVKTKHGTYEVFGKDKTYLGVYKTLDGAIFKSKEYYGEYA